MVSQLPPREGLDLVLRQLARLVEFSLNLDGTESDSHHLLRARNSQREGEIIYVFDHTALEMFLAIDDRTRRYAAAFHRADWRNTTRKASLAARKLEDEWISINEQTAIVASEYLMSGELPGQRDGQIYMTPGHYEEFCNAVDRRSLEAANTAAGYEETIKEIVSAVRGEQAFESTKDIYLDEDVQALFRGDTHGAAAKEFSRTRLIAGLIGHHESALRLHQLSRATSREVLDRIVPLNFRFPLTGGSRIRTAGENDWRAVLEMTNARRGPEARLPRNLRRDGDAVSHVQWIARTQLASHQRIVFVTGDPLVLAAYKRWYNQRVLDDPAEPRVVRDIQQFAPILNLGNMKAGLQDSKVVFDRLREAVETPLLAFNLSATSEPDDVIGHARRADLVLRLDGIHGTWRAIEKFFEPRLTVDWYSRNREAFTEIAQSLRRLERIAIGLNSRFVERRVANLVSAYDTWSDDADLDEKPTKFIEALLEAAARQSVDLWFPVALEAFERGERGVEAPARTPALVRLELARQSSNTPALLVDVVEQWVSEGIAPEPLRTQEFRSRRHMVFAAAAMAAMRTARWGYAHRFAELAVAAASSGKLGDHDGKPNVATAAELQELLYLRALSCRLRIGAKGPVDFSGNDIWGQLLDQGLEALQGREASQSHVAPTFQSLRGHSETVALRGFYAAWFPILMNNASTGALAAGGESGYSSTRAKQEFEKLLDGLREALPLLDQASGSAEPKQLHLLNVQLRANVAAAYALTQVRRGFPVQTFHSRLGAAAIETAQWWEQQFEPDAWAAFSETLPSLVQLQLAIFLRDFSETSFPYRTRSRRDVPLLQLDEQLSPLLVAQLNAPPS